jgi:hypothetical protein
MQVDPIKAMLKAPGTKLLKLEYDELLSSFAFKFSLRRYMKGGDLFRAKLRKELTGRGLHSSTFQLNVSGFYGRGCI